MPLILTAGPAVEPVTLAEAKAHLRVDSPYEDSLIASLILAARLHVECALNLALITQSWSLYLDCWPKTGQVPIPLGPVSAVSAVRVYNGADQAAIVAPNLYCADMVSRPARLACRTGCAWPIPGREVNGIEIAFEAGFGATGVAVPAPLKQAILLLAAHWYEVREPVLLDAGKLEAPLTVAALLAPYRSARL
jgi:uncharacterized phiE125 gp8 family phage protein